MPSSKSPADLLATCGWSVPEAVHRYLSHHGPLRASAIPARWPVTRIHVEWAISRLLLDGRVVERAGMLIAVGADRVAA